jgi:VWFA-related protein
MLRTLLLCLALPLPLAAQAPADTAAPTAPTPKPSGVTLSVPLLVREKKGAPVATPNKDELTLSEDSQPQTILTMSPAGSQPLTFGILVDTSNAVRGYIADEKTASKSFVDAMIKDKNQGFVVHFDREVELLTDLTRSQDKLENGVSLLDTAAPASPSSNADTLPTDTPGRSSQRAQTLLYDAIFLASDEITSKQSGRKALVIFSGGVDHGSKETLRSAIDTAQQSGTVLYAVYLKGEEKRDENQGLDNGQGRQRGGGYPGGGRFPGGGGGYPGGGYPGGGGGQRRPQQQSQKVDGKRILADIVTPTGGRVLELNKKENAAAVYAMIEDDLAHQSVATFMPDKAGARPGFHSLRITSKTDKTIVEAPDGFYIPEPK